MDYKNFALELASEAGKIIKANFSLGMKKEWKADNTPLTETDLKINQLVIDAVKREFPGHSIIAEEGSDFSDKSEYVWVCDPVDGTIPFSHGIPTCVFSLALVRKGESILGVIYDPFLDRMFFAEKGEGATLNGVKISVSRATSLQNALVGLVWWKSDKTNLSKVDKIISDRGATLIDVKSIVYMDMLVANGEFVATLFPGTKPYDTAAGKIIIEEAGGKVTDLFGNEQRYDRDIKGHITSNGILHEELVNIVKANL
ncbi:MAG: inositol monophosphatase [Candidatus Liptonbacteria bacterium]|nr:inositol monophosphatase [Candidatus Liptonbacteria bacterium]